MKTPGHSDDRIRAVVGDGTANSGSRLTARGAATRARIVNAAAELMYVKGVAATTLGETGGDTVTMTLNWGYLVGTAIFLSLLVILVVLQIAAKKFHPVLYWATIVASTTAGTTLADFADRSLGVGYPGGSLILLLGLMIVLARSSSWRPERRGVTAIACYANSASRT